jgi:hypothetical protein
MAVDLDGDRGAAAHQTIGGCAPAHSIKAFDFDRKL